MIPPHSSEPTHASRGTNSIDRLLSVPEVLAAIDIGTNSIHMVVARSSATDRFEIITRHKEVVRLGSGGASTLDQLEPDAIDRGIDALRRCRTILDTYDAPYLALATSAVREARNRSEFIDRAREEAGIDVEVISGYEEARLILLGILQALPLFETRLLMCDIGGGSTELLVGHRGEIEMVRSFKLGAIRLTERFFPGGESTPKRLKAARQFTQDLIAPFAKELRTAKMEVMVGSSGTIETLFRIARAADGSERQMLNGAVMSRGELTDVVNRLAGCRDPAERAQLPGMDESRADIIVGGAVILERVMKLARMESITYSDNALREGALFDLSSRLSGRTLHTLSDLRRSSVEHLMELCDDDPEHSVQVSRLAMVLFDALSDELGLADESAGILESAALLANVGLFISHSRHHKHTYYVIRNSEHLMGFTDHEIELVAQVARYHRRSDPHPKHEPYALLDDGERHIVRALAGILRVAIGLDRSHGQSVQSVSVSIDESSKGTGAVTIDITPMDDADVTMEVFAVTERSTLLQNVLGRDVHVHVSSQ